MNVYLPTTYCKPVLRISIEKSNCINCNNHSELSFIKNADDYTIYIQAICSNQYLGIYIYTIPTGYSYIYFILEF